MKKILLYSLYIIVVLVCCIYYLFPSDEVKKYITNKLKKNHSDISITIGSVVPSFPPGMNLHVVKIFKDNSQLFEIKHVKVVPGILSLFSKEKTFSFKGKSYNGDLEGKGVIIKTGAGKENKLHIAIDADLKKIHAYKIPAVKNLSDYKISSGLLDGKIGYDTKDSDNKLKATLILSACTAQITAPFSKIKLIKPNIRRLLPADLRLDEKFVFKNINTEFSMDSNKKVDIKQFAAKGSQINANMSGTVTTRTPFARTSLKLTGDFMMHPSFISALGKAFPMASSFMKKYGSKQTFRISGSVERPRVF
ncbi:MAG: type II secretion system protein GspN [Desulfobacteraceae bacterium]|nr:type II secretion system protein GspN [Desulfobacteraceae bacterium]